LTIDVENSGKGEDKIGILLQHHMNSPKSMFSKLATSADSQARHTGKVEPARIPASRLPLANGDA
jgi:hypothetical protein